MQPFSKIDPSVLEALKIAVPFIKSLVEPAKIEAPKDFTDMGLLAYARETALKIQADERLNEILKDLNKNLAQEIERVTLEDNNKSEKFQEEQAAKKRAVGSNL